MAMTKQEREMITDIFHLIDNHADDYQLSKYETIVDEYGELWRKWRRHPMIIKLGAAAIEYLEARWKHVYGEKADR